ncbi:Protein CBG04695 [Caenorhabditis briggsae]|uniref:Protein CBG04695 n=1 Tax=Caenorhabditis briggsae TaxID=6238 RepID=A8WY90_CAEBR|nr:Protein CBG04695 [Caenorhabditis briggsae]CAP25348.2 Protein CBG04695 [Caenorhabditis briggsae]
MNKVNKMLKNQICVLKILDSDKDLPVTLGIKWTVDSLKSHPVPFICLCSSKVAFALIASLALASALPDLGSIIGGGENGGIGGVVGGSDGGLGGIIGGGNGEGIGGIVGDLLGGNQDVLQNLLSVLGGNPGGLGLPIPGNITEIPSFLTDILGDLPEETIQKITDLLGEDLPISELLSRLDALLPEGVLEQLLATVAELVSKLLAAISKVLNNLQPVFDQLSDILNNKNQKLEQQAQAIDALKQKFPVEIDTIFYIASQVEKTLQGGNGGVVPELPEVPSVPETPQIPF